MAKEALVGQMLSPEMVKAGRALLEQLDTRPIHVTGALWLFLPEAFTWRLVFAAPEVRLEGPKKVYSKIKSASAKLPADSWTVSISDISVSDDRAPFIQALRMLVNVEGGEVRVSRSSINGMFVEDALIYRMR